MSLEPQPMGTAPKNGGWVLGLVLSEGAKPGSGRQPWEHVTWGDGGWHDDDGNSCEPVAWVPLPDPQPNNTGWMPPEGTIRVVELEAGGWTSNGKPIEVSWRWMVEIERSDGSRDDYRDCDFRDTQEQAAAVAARWAAQFGLPIKVVPLPPVPSNVVQMRRAPQTESDEGDAPYPGAA